MDEIRILSPCGILGYGFPAETFAAGVAKNPHLIAVDAGSTDAGPHKLGSGQGIVSRQAAKKDLEHILAAGYEKRIPVIIGSAGGAGAKAHVDWTMDIIGNIIAENGYHFKTAIINADIDKEYVRKKLEQGEITSLSSAPTLTEANLDITDSIVGQMGHEPIITALEQGAQLIVAGRCFDPAVFAAYPIWKGYDAGLAYHLGKILECGALCADPGTAKDCIIGYLRADHFIVEPLSEQRRCYTVSVAAHTLYEKNHPYIQYGPGVELNLSDCTFEQADEHSVKVSGSKLKAIPYTVKLEGAAKVAYRTLVIAGIRDPIMIENMEQIKKDVCLQVGQYFSEIPTNQYEIIFHLYGKDGVMGPLEPCKDMAHELGLVMEVVAQTQDMANTICSAARSTLLHFPYPGRKSTAGNLAFLYSPSDLVVGPVYKFTIYHLMQTSDPLALFPVRIFDLG